MGIYVKSPKKYFFIAKKVDCTKNLIASCQTSNVQMPERKNRFFYHSNLTPKIKDSDYRLSAFTPRAKISATIQKEIHFVDARFLMASIFKPDIDPEQFLSGAKFAILTSEEEQAEHDRRRDATFLKNNNITYQQWQSENYRAAIAYGPSEDDLADPDVDIY